jgi:putative ABC transport system permease protein
MLTLLREISLRHFLHAPLRTLVVLAGIALGVSMLVATTMVNDSMLGAFSESVGRVVGKTDLIVTGSDVGVSSELVEEIREAEGVAHVAGTLEIVTRRPGAGGPLLVLGVDLVGDPHFLPIESADDSADWVEDPLELVADPTGILVSQRLAMQEKLEVGSKLELITSEGARAFTVRGVLVDKGPLASFEGQVAVMYLDAAQLAFGRGDRVDRIDVALAEGVAVGGLQDKLQKLVGGRGKVEKPEGRKDQLRKMLGPLATGVQVSGFIALMVGMFLIYNAVSVAVSERRREIGVLRALGVTRRDAVIAFCLEAGLLGAMGGALGLLFASAMAHPVLDQTAANVSQFYAAIRPPSPKLTPLLALYGIGAGVVLSIFAAYLPARRAAEVDPVEALRRSRGSIVSPRRLPHRRMLLASAVMVVPSTIAAWLGREHLMLAFAAIGLFILAGVLALPSFVVLMSRALSAVSEMVLGVAGRLAIDNVQRSLERSVLTAAALTVAVGSSISIATWGESLEASMMQWLEHMVPADILITAGSPFADQHNVPFHPDVVDKLNGTPGVRGIQRARLLNQEVGTQRIQLLALDSAAYFEQQKRRGRYIRYVEGGPVDAEQMKGAPRVLLSETAALRLHTKTGEKVAFSTPTGTHDFEVCGLFVDYTSDQGLGFIDRSWFDLYWQDELVDNIDLYLEDDASLEGVMEEVRRRFGGDRSLFITPSAKLREEIKKILLQSMSVLQSTEIICLIVAILGVMGTMLAAVLDRIREIGVLRAVGATRAQVALSIVAEAGFLGLTAAAAGLLLGVPLGLVFVHAIGMSSTGWRVDYSFPVLSAMRVMSAVVLTAMLAGLLPGRRAASMDVTDALGYE